MKYRTSDEIRDIWLNFFKSKGHFIEPSSSLIPQNDPTLLWINSGVAALKKYFDGTTIPPHKRIVNAQKSLRTNDIENVGKTARHHTFFEMLGNFSIGDYFREDVIPWAFELLTSEQYYGFDKDKLYITYYPDDLETKRLWLKCGVSEDHLLPCKDNFWEIGEGPCGPDTEINYDRGEKYDPQHLGTKLITEDLPNDRFVEIWNIVFSMYNSKPNLQRSEYPLLPHKNIDTGCSLERLACIIQNSETNFETDFFKPIIDEIAKNSQHKYEGEYKFYYRVIADHIRSLVFTLADGASFSNDGRGYVLRRLLRRASKYAHNLGLKTGFLSTLVKVVIKSMHKYYPYLDVQEQRISKIIKTEEEKFAKTLLLGEKQLSQYMKEDGDTLSGEHAFKLSDTFGFPIELTLEICQQQNKKVDIEKFYKLLENQKQTARNARNTVESFVSQNGALMEFTEKSEFVYEDKNISGKVIAIFKDYDKVEVLEDGEGIVILNKTNFYAESGGQIPDIGYIKNKNCECEVFNVQKAPNHQHMLFVKVNYGSVKVGDSFKQYPDFGRRAQTRKNHSSCHLLQASLQKLIDKNIKQQGSFVSNDMMRFDFSFDRKLTSDEIDSVERLVNEKINENIICKTEVLDKDEALKLDAMHLFDEKYASKVRVVSFGDFSKEFCAGTHVSNSKDIGLFTIVSEQAIASGVRRIIAYTGFKAYEYLKEKEKLLDDIAYKLSLNSYKEIDKKLDQVNVEIEQYKKKIQQLESKVTSLTSNDVNFEIINGVNFALLETNNFSHNQIVETVSKIKGDKESTIVLLLNQNLEKADVCVGVSNNLLNKYRAGDLVKKVCLVLNGSGGGRNDIAFGGVKTLENKKQAIEELKNNL